MAKLMKALIFIVVAGAAVTAILVAAKMDAGLWQQLQGHMPLHIMSREQGPDFSAVTGGLGRRAAMAVTNSTESELSRRSNGMRRRRCPGGRVRCGSACVDIRWDSRNCGGCRRRCSLQSRCCNGRCINVMSNPRHCNSCSFTKCTTCSMGVCDYVK